MKILVTGGAGFIGSNFVNFAHRASGGHVIVLDNLTYAAEPKNFDKMNRGEIVLVTGDIADERLVYHLLENVNSVVHFAAETHNTRSENDPNIFFKTNVEGTRALMSTIRKFQNDTKRTISVVHVSTDEVYGPAQPGVFFEEEDFGKPGNKPTSAYSQSKFEADLMVRTDFEDLRAVVVRPTNNFGKGQHPEKALPRWICAALEDRPLEVWGEGRQVRDWLYAGDTALIITRLLDYAPPGAYNVAANHDPEITNIELARMVLDVLGKDYSLIKLVDDPRPNHDFRYGIDTTKLRSSHWLPEDFWPRDFREQLEQTVRWYQQNVRIWKPKIAEAEALYKK